MNILVPILLVIVVIGLSIYLLSFFDAPVEKKVIVREDPLEHEYVEGISEGGEPVRVRDLCIALCMEQKEDGLSLKDGPCLSNEIAPDWVCDVSHDPRKEVDDLKENQCLEYGKTANHFVEVEPSCKFIREK